MIIILCPTFWNKMYVTFIISTMFTISERKQSSLSGKERAQGCLPKRLLGRPD